MEIYESGSMGTIDELAEEILARQRGILHVISTKVPVKLINDSYKMYGEFCYICGDGKCVDIQKENMDNVYKAMGISLGNL